MAGAADTAQTAKRTVLNLVARTDRGKSVTTAQVRRGGTSWYACATSPSQQAEKRKPWNGASGKGHRVCGPQVPAVGLCTVPLTRLPRTSVPSTLSRSLTTGRAHALSSTDLLTREWRSLACRRRRSWKRCGR